MKLPQLLAARLKAQCITGKRFDTPNEIASWMGATQAQDYYAGKYALAVRLRGVNDTAIEQAIADKSIVRSWAMRGTLQFMAPQDIRDILQVIAPRFAAMYASYFRKYEMDTAALKKIKAVITKAIQGGKQLTRKEMMEVWEKKGIRTHDLRANFLMLRTAIDGVICCGERRGKEFTYTLLDEWIPTTKPLKYDEALVKLTCQYINSRGPVTVQDYAWWAGLTQTEAKRAFELVKDQFNSEAFESNTYLIPDSIGAKHKGVFMLPSFDEYLIAYKDRSPMLESKYNRQVMGTGNGLFSPIIVIDGKIAGTWKRTLNKNVVTVEAKTFLSLSTVNKKAVASEANRYAKFLEMELNLI